MSGKAKKHHHLLPAKFFEQNTYEEHSAQRFVYSILLNDGLEEIADKLIRDQNFLGADRLENANSERDMILALDDPEVILNLLRKNTDVANRPVLVKKALEYEGEILPKVAEKLIRNNHDTFIENAIRLLAKSHEDYSVPLKERFTEIRSPYVQSLVCLIIGFRGGEDAIPWMLDRYYELKKQYPDESYAEGPLLALYELNARFC